MKKYLIILMILSIVMGVFIVDILGRSITDIQKRMVGQINYRINVVKGIVESENINKTYNCYIAGETVVYPNIPTFSRNPKLQSGDEVTIEFINGCRETPCILASEDIREVPDTTLPVSALRYGLIIASPNEVKTFDMEGAVLHLLTAGGWAYSACDITIDADGNSYTETGWNTLKKYDSGGNLLVTRLRELPSTWFESLNFGPDGYLYTLEGRAVGYAIAKRYASDLTVVADAVTLVDNYTGGICLDSDGNFYIYNMDTDKIEKWSSGGILLASLFVGTIAEYAGFGICGTNLYVGDTSSKIYYMPLNLAGYTEWAPGYSIFYGITVADGHLITTGWDTDGDGATEKWDSGRNKIWSVKLGGIAYGYKAGGYNF